MAGIPIGSNSMGYTSLDLKLANSGNERNLLTRNLAFGITGASYLAVAGGTTSLIFTTGSTAKLYIRDLLSSMGTTANDYIILTDSNGNGSIEFVLDKGVIYDLNLLYSPNGVSYDNDDYTNPITLTFPPVYYGAGCQFSVTDQMITPQSAVTGSVNLSGIFYDGSTAITGTIQIYKPLINVGVSGSTANIQNGSGGLTGILIGTAGVTPFATSNVIINSNANFDSVVGDYYMVYYLNGSSGVTAGYSYNYVGLTGVDLPFSAEVIYNSSSIGTTATIYNPIFNFTGLTSGRLYIDDNQSNTSVTRDILLSPNNTPYVQYFFGPTGGAPVVLSGSRVGYSYLGNKSKNYFDLTPYSSSNNPENIIGTLNAPGPSIKTNKKITAQLTGFDYTDSEGNSIFANVFGGGATGILYLVSQDDGCTAGLYSGPTSLVGSTGIIVNPYNSVYNIEFVTGVTSNVVTKNYTASFYDSTLGSLRSATGTFSLGWPGLTTVPENILGNFVTNTTSTNMELTVTSFDYLDEYGDSILSGSSGHTGYIQLLQGQNGPPLKGITYSFYNPSGTYTINYPGTYFPNIPQYFYVGFFDSNKGPTGTLRTSTTPITATRPASTNPERFICAIEDFKRDPTISLTNFDYLDSSGSSIFRTPGVTGATGFIQLFDPAGTMLQQRPNTTQLDTIYMFDIPMPPGASGYSPFVGYYLKFFNSTANMLMPASFFIESGITGTTNTNTVGGTASNWQGSFTGPTAAYPANFIFPYEFQANASDIIRITLLGELNFGPSGGVLESIRMSVPFNELQRMFVYNTGWANGMTGLGVTGLSGLSGSTSQSSMFGGQGATGPNVALLLQYVLSNLNISSGYTGASGGFNQSDRLKGLDALFSTDVPTHPQNGIQGPGNPWNMTSVGGPTGGAPGILGYPSSLTGGYFVDDSGLPCAQLALMIKQNAGPTGFTYPPNSLLNIIPIEAVKTITNTGLQIPKFSGTTGLFKDIDTTISTYRPALQNLFEQAVAFNRISDTQTTPVSSLGSLSSGIGPWLANSTIYKVDFAIGDTLSLYVNYQFGQVRQYGIDPTVVSGLGPKFTSAPVYSLTYGGRTFNIPIGQQDMNASGYQNGYNMGTPSSLALENSIQNSSQTIEIRLVATDPSLKSMFDY